jgi:hypothetical protein
MNAVAIPHFDEVPPILRRWLRLGQEGENLCEYCRAEDRDMTWLSTIGTLECLHAVLVVSPIIVCIEVAGLFRLKEQAWWLLKGAAARGKLQFESSAS